jgi:hypothetical protein
MESPIKAYSSVNDVLVIEYSNLELVCYLDIVIWCFSTGECLISLL